MFLSKKDFYTISILVLFDKKNIKKETTTIKNEYLKVK